MPLSDTQLDRLVGVLEDFKQSLSDKQPDSDGSGAPGPRPNPVRSQSQLSSTVQLSPSEPPLIGALIAVQTPVAEGDKVTAWQAYGYSSQLDPATDVAVHGNGAYDARFDKPALRKPS